MVPHLSSWYFSHVIAGAEAVSAEAGYDFLVIGVGSRAECSRLLDERYHLERRTDGVVLVNMPASDDEAESLRSRGIALATVGSYSPGYPSVRGRRLRRRRDGGAAPGSTGSSTPRADHRPGRRPDELRGATTAPRRLREGPRRPRTTARPEPRGERRLRHRWRPGGDGAPARSPRPADRRVRHVRRDGLRCAHGTRASWPTTRRRRVTHRRRRPRVRPRRRADHDQPTGRRSGRTRGACGRRQHGRRARAARARSRRRSSSSCAPRPDRRTRQHARPCPSDVVGTSTSSCEISNNVLDADRPDM